jgi:hypothetical protein
LTGFWLHRALSALRRRSDQKAEVNLPGLALQASCQLPSRHARRR